MTSTNPLRFASLFSGAGGLDVGFEQAGWHCVYASDVDADCVETLTINSRRKVGRSRVLSDCVVEQADVCALSGREILSKAGVSRGELSTLVGGPPCQSWSSAGHQLGFGDPRGRLLGDYVRLANELDVRWLVFENVRGLLTARGHDGEPGSALEHVRMELLDAGFHTEVRLLNAADYGVPQRRVRLFMIGFRAGDRPVLPSATHARDGNLFREGMERWVSLRDGISCVGALEDHELVRPSASLAKLLAKVSPGSGVRSAGKKESTRPGGHWGYRQGCFVADPTLPARTVTASSQQDWVRDETHGLRRLCPRECAGLQTFPKSWVFAGNRQSQYRQIGNAVPVLLAKMVASALGEHVESMASFRARSAAKKALIPLDASLESAIRYTKKEERRNGESRRAASAKRVVR